MKKIFISYRREETRHAAHRIYSRLVSAFGKENVFFDVHALGLGDFRDGINHAVDQSAIVVAVVGREWLQLLRAKELRGEHDWVRYEVARALDRKIKVFPVRVDGAALLDAQSLPDDLKPLHYSQSLEVHNDPHFDSDLEIALDRIRDELDITANGSVPRKDPFSPAPFWDQREGRRRGRVMFFVAVLLWLGLIAYRELLPPADIDRAALGRLLYDNCWIHYDPAGKILDSQRQPIYPPLESMGRDLALIKLAGFSGIITSSSDGPMAEVPRLARETGLKIIMGVWEPADRREVSRAIRQARFVDAYCVGDNGLPGRYSLYELRRALYLIKRRTGLPAAVTEPVKAYDGALAELGDWLFPDAHLTLRDIAGGNYSADVERDVELFMKSTDALASLAKTSGRPLVFKNVAYPHAGFLDASRERQAEFYDQLLERLKDPQRGHGVKVAIVPLGAFDTAWKRYEPFFPWDPYTGLLRRDFPAAGDGALELPDRDDILTPAVNTIIRRYPHLDPELRGEDLR